MKGNGIVLGRDSRVAQVTVQMNEYGDSKVYSNLKLKSQIIEVLKETIKKMRRDHIEVAGNG